MGVPCTICYRVLLKRTSYVSPIDKRLPNKRIYFIPRARQAPIRKVLTKAEFLDLVRDCISAGLSKRIEIIHI